MTSDIQSVIYFSYCNEMKMPYVVLVRLDIDDDRHKCYVISYPICAINSCYYPSQ